MITQRFLSRSKRKTVIVGHYGSGKTEFAVSAMMLLANEIPYKRKAIVDLDIINPYFRSRERRDMLESKNVNIYGSVYKGEITAELPALAADVRAPLEDSDCFVIVDTGGNDSGAIVINQFANCFTDNTTVHAVVNKNRPETSTVEMVLRHIDAIESATNMNVTSIVNNTHLLLETNADTILEGHEFCKAICSEIGAELFCDCYPLGIVEPNKLLPHCVDLMPIGRFMRPTWA